MKTERSGEVAGGARPGSCRGGFALLGAAAPPGWLRCTRTGGATAFSPRCPSSLHLNREPRVAHSSLPHPHGARTPVGDKVSVAFHTLVVGCLLVFSRWRSGLRGGEGEVTGDRPTGKVERKRNWSRAGLGTPGSGAVRPPGSLTRKFPDLQVRPLRLPMVPRHQTPWLSCRPIRKSSASPRPGFPA